MTPEEFFKTKEQIKRYNYAVSIASQIKKYLESDYLVFDGNKEIIQGEAIIYTDFNEYSSSIFEIRNFNVTTVYIEVYYNENNKPWIEYIPFLKNYFKDFRFVHPNDVKKLSL